MNETEPKKEFTEEHKLTVHEFIAEYLDLKKEIDMLTAKKDNIKSQIIILFKELGLKNYIDDDGNCADYNTQTRESLDKKRVKELLGEIQFKEVLKSTTFDMLRVTSKVSKEKIDAMLKKKSNEVEQNDG